MTNHQRAAKAYLDRAIKTQKKLGYSPKVSPEAYAASLSKIERAFSGLASGRTAPAKQ